MNFFTKFFRSLEALANGDINRGEGFGATGSAVERQAEKEDRATGATQKAGASPRRPKT